MSQPVEQVLGEINFRIQKELEYGGYLSVVNIIVLLASIVVMIVSVSSIFYPFVELHILVMVFIVQLGVMFSMSTLYSRHQNKMNKLFQEYDAAARTLLSGDMLKLYIYMKEKGDKLLKKLEEK